MKRFDYWFTIEPYVYVGFGIQHVLLYNTLDASIIETTNEQIIALLKRSLFIDQCGVCLLKEEEYAYPEIFKFINKLKEYYMGDIIDISLSNKKPIQNTPYFNFIDKDLNVYKKNSFNLEGDIDGSLCKIDIYINEYTDVYKLMFFLKTMKKDICVDIIGDMDSVNNIYDFICFLQEKTENIYNVINYKLLKNVIENNISYKLEVDFPLDINIFNDIIKNLKNQSVDIEYIFDITSEYEYYYIFDIMNKYDIKNKYIIRPKYNGNNLYFFENYVYFEKEDILKNPLSIKDIFIHQSINVFDFGKISILPNGDVYSNINYPVLGNIYKQTIDDIIRKEIKDGHSWFRIRSEAPCINCAYQWLCPSPSDYEISIGKPNLCHINKN